MERVGQNLMQLELPGGQPAVTDVRHISVIAFVFTLKSVASLATQLPTICEVRWSGSHENTDRNYTPSHL